MLIVSSPAEVEAMIGGGWRVLDVGSGDRPFARATVLVDRLPRRQEGARGVSTENPTATIVNDGKPFVVGELEALPFADQSFDFVVASHVIEHATDPLRAAAELARVAPRGYLECPRAWFEFVDASPFHRWFIDVTEGELLFRPKTRPEAEFIQARRLFDRDPRLFEELFGHVFSSVDPSGTSIERSMCHISLFWEERIPCRVVENSLYRSTSI